MLSAVQLNRLLLQMSERHMLRKILILVSFFLGGTCLAEPATPVAATVEILSAELGLFDASDPGAVGLSP